MALRSRSPSGVVSVPERTTTVIEFAAEHCAEHGSVTEKDVSVHVNAIILAALTQNRALWTVGIDAEGRASLIWVSLPARVWEHLLSEGAQLVTVMTWFGEPR